MPRSLDDVARDAAPLLAELVRKYPPRAASTQGSASTPPSDADRAAS